MLKSVEESVRDPVQDTRVICPERLRKPTRALRMIGALVEIRNLRLPNANRKVYRLRQRTRAA